MTVQEGSTPPVDAFETEMPTASLGAEGPARGAYAPGARFGRYTVLDEIGRGGMGVVYRAYDPQLERQVALKILPLAANAARAAEAAKLGVRLADRLIREAQVLARLTHPNVVAVHDLGTVDDAVFVAMELVDGVTLRRWASLARRTAREVVRVFAAAGQGLAAAHAAGIVHRDFKPDNVMLGADGRVRVLDFGLAHTADATADERSATVGPLVGTHAYMAPELFEGRAADPRSDQYAYCVSLLEALTGARPVRASSASGDAKETVFRDVPSARAIPRHVRRVLARGLASSPDRRYPSMAALLDDLARDPAERARRWAPLAASALTIVVALAVGRRMADARHAMCRGAEAKAAGVWGDGQREAVRRAFVATGLESANVSAERAIAMLDAYARAWAAARTDACEATRVRGEQSEAVLDLRMACFDRRLAALAAEANVLAAADATVVGKSALAVADVPRIEACADLGALRAAMPLPEAPEARAAVDATVATLSEARALVTTGKYDEAATRAKTALDRARAIPFRPLEAEALFLLGRADGMLARYPAAEEELEASARAAIAGRRDDTLAEAWTELVRVQGPGQLHFDAAHATAKRAEAAVERAAFDDALASNLLRQEGDLGIREGKYEDARAASEEAVRRAEKAYGANDVHVAGALLQLGMAESSLDHLDRAEAVFHRSIAILRGAGLAEHTNVAAAINNLGYIESMRGHEADALRMYREALEMWLRCLGPAHPQVADARLNIGSTLVGLGRVDEGLVELEKARDAYVALRGKGSLDEALLLGELAAAHTKKRDYPRALPLYEEAIAIYEAKGGDPDRLYAYAGRGEARMALHRYADARADLERALAITTANQGANHPQALELRLIIAETLFGERRAAEALARVRALRAQIVAANPSPQLVVHALLDEARIASNLPTERSFAAALAKSALPRIAELPAGAGPLAARIERWIAEGAPPAPLDDDLAGPVAKP